LIALLAVWALVNLATLTRYPVAQCDEGYYGSVAATFAAEGRFGTPILGDLDDFRTNYMAIGRLHAGGLALLFRVLGVGLWQIRLFSYLGWLALIGMTYLCARRWYGPVPGVVAAALAGLSPSVMLRARIGRPEVWLSVLLLIQLLLYTELRARPRRSLSFMLGALISLSLATHFNAILFGFPLAVLVAHWFVIRRRDWKMLGLFVLGGLLGGVAVGVAQLLPDWRGALEQYRIYLDVFGIQPGSLSLGEALSTQAGWLYQNFIQLLPFLGVAETLTFIMGLIAALARRTEADVALVFAFLFALAVYTFQVAKAWYHVLPWLALGTLLFAGSIPWWQERAEGWPVRWLNLLRVEWAAAPLALLYLAGSV